MIAANKNRLHVVVLLDGRPGHEKQTKGIIQALQAEIEVKTTEIKVEPASWVSTLRQFFLLFLPGRGWSDPRIEGADLLLATGSRTHLPLLHYKKRYSIPAVVCMSPPFIIRGRFDRCFVPEHDGLEEQGNVIHTIGAPNCSTNKNRHQRDCGLILLGGVDFKSHHWQSRKISEMVRRIVLKETSRHWTISSSPRTPIETVELMRELSVELANVSFFDYKETQPGWIETQYDKSHVVWVTSDSISMIYEALTAGCRVGIIPMQWKKRESKFKKNEDLLLNKGLVISFASWEQGSAIWGDNVELNEAHRCAERILEIWWPKN